MHIAHHQLFWEKRSENESNGITWQRSEYTHYVTAQLTDEQTIADFLNSFRQARAGPARPARQGPTPNDRSSCPPKSSEDERVEQIRSNIAERFKKSMRKAAQKESKTSVDISSSETETMAQPVKPILAKGMPTKGQKKSEIPESSAAASSSSASASKSAAIPVKEDRRKPVKSSAAKRETSARARELFKDAEAAKEVYSKFKQEFIEIQSSALKAHNVVKKR